MGNGQRSALVIGGTGLVGSLCVEWLLADGRYKSVTTIVRRSPIFSPPKLNPLVVDFDKLDGIAPMPVDDVFCALGTTIKKAGSQDAFRKVDYEYAVAIARWAISSGATQFGVVSAVGASAESSNFYLRVKGEMEQAISGLPFQSINIFRPSILVGNRSEKRAGEVVAARIASALKFAMAGSLRKYRPVDALTVAAAMVGAAVEAKPGTNIHTFDEIRALAKAYSPHRLSMEEVV